MLIPKILINDLSVKLIIEINPRNLFLLDLCYYEFNDILSIWILSSYDDACVIDFSIDFFLYFLFLFILTIFSLFTWFNVESSVWIFCFFFFFYVSVLPFVIYIYYVRCIFDLYLQFCHIVNLNMYTLSNRKEFIFIFYRILVWK